MLEINLKDNVIQILRSSVSSLHLPTARSGLCKYAPCTASTMAWLVARPGPSTISRRLMPLPLFIRAAIRLTSRREATRKVECQKMLSVLVHSSCGLKDLLPCCFCRTEIAIFLFFLFYSIESGYIYFKLTKPNSLFHSSVACLTFLFQFTTIFHLKSLIVLK